MCDQPSCRQSSVGKMWGKPSHFPFKEMNLCRTHLQRYVEQYPKAEVVVFAKQTSVGFKIG